MSNESIHVTEWGSSGPRVVMVHGSAQGSDVGGDRHFSAQECLGQRGWRLVVPDRPGHGRSPSPGRPDDAEADGELVAELLGDGAHLVGHSFGGCVALAAAARKPSAVRSLTLIEPAMPRLAMKDPVVRRFGLQTARTLFLTFSPVKRIDRFAALVNIPDDLRGGSSLEEKKRMGKAIRRLKLPSGKVLQRQLDRIKEANVPLLVVTGGWSPSFDITADTVAAAGGGRHVVIRSDHHFPQRVSDEFNDLLTAFMTEADTAHATR
ncbi:MAG: alpha/beta hydrolase [Actinomycetota bacterium]|nr:alpha/beta hydrolase [Actinomycetota bacterium]